MYSEASKLYFEYQVCKEEIRNKLLSKEIKCVDAELLSKLYDNIEILFSKIKVLCHSEENSKMERFDLKQQFLFCPLLLMTNQLLNS